MDREGDPCALLDLPVNGAFASLFDAFVNHAHFQPEFNESGSKFNESDCVGRYSYWKGP
jgi:hypothetical protein